ncbi:MAG: helix-turn-helix domain-containing protein [Lachnospiraceae bacterium]|nr:helix-turn-helix domain-containing protein [Lachnospiraceae bacterium]
MELTIGKRIAQLRKEKGLTQEELSQMMEVSAQAVSKWENDLTCPDISSLPKLAKILGVTVDALLSGKEEAAPVAQVLPPENRKELKDMMLRIVVDENGGDHVKINIPMALIQVALDMGMELPQVSGNSALKSLDLTQIVNMVRQGAVGNLMEVETDDTVVRLFVE